MPINEEGNKLIRDIEKLRIAGQSAKEIAKITKTSINYVSAILKLLGLTTSKKCPINIFARKVYKNASIRVDLKQVGQIFDFERREPGTHWRVADAKANKIIIEFEN